MQIGLTLVLVLFAASARSYQILHDDGSCSCESIEVVSTSEDVADKHAAVMGSYR